MKKLLMLVAIMSFAGFAMAQTYTQGTGITGVDKLGAHQNGGRGCTGCHAPHSGARGGGGNAATGGGPVTDPNTGNYALWGQDLGPLYGKTLGFGDTGGYGIVLPAASTGLTPEQENVLTGVVMCLSCHDGNFAQGAMMTNQSYEQAMNLLPPNLYGPNPIPTLLGQDGTALGNYQNDHPIGPSANLTAVGVASNFVYTAGGCTWHGAPGDCLKIAGSATKYQLFADHYGAPSIISNGHSSPLVLPDTTAGNAYLVCTTCHTPHSMYTASANSDAPIATLTSGTFPTYFFLAAPYNPGSNPDAQHASSATQFCRQCHFTGAGGSNEGSGINTVTTAF